MNLESDNIIFLDIDGVLNTWAINPKETAPTGFSGIYSSKAKILKEIVDATSAKIVLSSTWRVDWDKDYEKCTKDGKYLVDRLAAHGIEIFDKLDGESTAFRGREIIDYVNKHKPKRWIVIDDENFPDFKSHGIRDVGKNPKLVLIGAKNGGGLQPKHVKIARDRMFNFVS